MKAAENYENKSLEPTAKKASSGLGGPLSSTDADFGVSDGGRSAWDTAHPGQGHPDPLVDHGAKHQDVMETMGEYADNTEPVLSIKAEASGD